MIAALQYLRAGANPLAVVAFSLLGAVINTLGAARNLWLDIRIWWAERRLDLEDWLEALD